MTTVRSAVQEFLYAKRHLRATSIREKVQRLGVFCEWCERQGIQLEDIKARTIGQFEETLDGRAGYTKLGYVRVIKGFLMWCSKEEDYEDEVQTKTAQKVALPKVSTPTIDLYTAHDVNALLNACKKEETPYLIARNRAIISVLIDTGIRASECCYDPTRPQEHTGLGLEHVCLETFDSHILVIGKGSGAGKQREIGLGDASRKALKAYLRHRSSRHEKDSLYVFLGRDGSPLSVRGLEMMVTRLAEYAGVAHAYCHKFRHTFAVNYLLQAGKDADGAALYKLMRLLGHTDIKTTAIYLRAMDQQEARRGGSVLDNLK